MSANVIISYDGTANDDDALALGKLLTRDTSKLALAYVRHAPEFDPSREALAKHDAERRLEQDALAAMLGAQIVAAGTAPADLIIVGSQPGAPKGRIALSGSARSILDASRGSVLVVPSGKPLRL